MFCFGCKFGMFYIMYILTLVALYMFIYYSENRWHTHKNCYIGPSHWHLHWYRACLWFYMNKVRLFLLCIYIFTHHYWSHISFLHDISITIFLRGDIIYHSSNIYHHTGLVTLILCWYSFVLNQSFDILWWCIFCTLTF